MITDSAWAANADDNIEFQAGPREAWPALAQSGSVGMPPEVRSPP